MALPSGQASVTQGVLSNLCADSSCKLQHEAKPSELGEESPHSCFLHLPGGTKEFWGDSRARGGPPPQRFVSMGGNTWKPHLCGTISETKWRGLGMGEAPHYPDMRSLLTLWLREKSFPTLEGRSANSQQAVTYSRIMMVFSRAEGWECLGTSSGHASTQSAGWATMTGWQHQQGLESGNLLHLRKTQDFK